MKKFKHIASFFILLIVFLFIASPVLAQYGLNETGVAAGLVQKGSEGRTITDIIAIVINVALSLVGIAFFGLLIYAGILYLTAQGDDSQTKKARQLIKDAVIGLVIVIAAYAIASFVVSRIVTKI